MKDRVQSLLPLSSLIACISLILVQNPNAQTFTTLYGFANANDGANPYGIILSGKTLYGTATFGGRAGNGAVFAINSDGSGFTNLHSFAATNGISGGNSDGVEPNGLVLSGKTLYGTATLGGASGNGVVFAVNVDGTGFTNLHSFTALDAATATTNSDGAYPYAGLVLSANVLYGTTQGGGLFGNGAVFLVNIDGTGFTNLHSFTALDAATATTNGDGANPYAGLILSDNVLYGTTQAGGLLGDGTVFAIKADGTGFTNLHSFTALDAATDTTNSDGANPYAGLILSGKTLYGTAYYGGSSGNGTVFAVDTDGTGFTNLHSFTDLDTATSTTNSDGANPYGGLTLSGRTLYGTAYDGGSSGNGTVFAVNTDGTAFMTLHSFTALDAATGTFNSDGANPSAGLILSGGNTLAGTAFNGGSAGNGTMFIILLPPPQLTALSLETTLVLMWPTNATGFALESSTNLAAQQIWTTVSTAPGLVNGQNAVTNAISGPQQFFRLSQKAI